MEQELIVFQIATCIFAVLCVAGFIISLSYRRLYKSSKEWADYYQNQLWKEMERRAEDFDRHWDRYKFVLDENSKLRKLLAEERKRHEIL